MDESSDEDVIPKTDQKPFSIQLKPSLDSNFSLDLFSINYNSSSWNEKKRRRARKR